MMDKINELLDKATKIDKEVNGEKETEKREKELMEEEKSEPITRKKYCVYITRVIRIPIEAKNRDEANETVGSLDENYINGFDYDENIDIEEEE